MKSSPSIFLLSLLPLSAWAFVTPTPTTSLQRNSLVSELSAKKNKKNRSSSGEGFGKQAAAAPPTSSAATIQDDGTSPRAFQSIDNSAQTSTPPTTPPSEQLNLDPNLSEEERSQEILRQRFGLKSYEEQQADAGDYRAILDAEKKKEKRNKLRNIENIWPENKNVVEMLPPGVVKGIDTFLKAGLGLTTTLFILSGFFIVAEAGSKATGKALPGGLEDFAVNVVEPNFTPGLGVLLLFSVSLGLFTIGLGGSAASSYREDP